MPAEDGGRAQQFLDGLHDGTKMVVVVLICLFLAPSATILEAYYYITGQSEKAQWSGTSYEHDHIDELWKRSRDE